MQAFAWMGFEIALPDDWECVKYGRNPARGECAFADRTGARMGLAWSKAAGGADVPKLLRDLIAQVRRTEGDAQGPPAEYAAPDPWRGFLWKGKERMAVAVAHFPKAGRLMKAQFARGRESDERLERRILESLTWQDAGGTWLWRAFGCCLSLPSSFAVERCEVLPGKAVIEFRSPGRGGEAVRLQRLALPDAVLKGRGFFDWYSSRLPKGARAGGQEECEVRGHKGLRIETSLRPASAWQSALGRRRRGVAMVWICEKEGRLYCAEWEGARGAAPSEPGRIVECA